MVASAIAAAVGELRTELLGEFRRMAETQQQQATQASMDAVLARLEQLGDSAPGARVDPARRGRQRLKSKDGDGAADTPSLPSPEVPAPAPAAAQQLQPMEA